MHARQLKRVAPGDGPSKAAKGRTRSRQERSSASPTTIEAADHCVPSSIRCAGG